MSNPIVIFNLGSDARVDVEIIQSYKMSIKISKYIQFKQGKSYLQFIIFYYTNGLKIPLLTQYGGRIYLGYEGKFGGKEHNKMDNTTQNKLYYLQEFIKSFKKNKPVKSKLWINQCAWLSKNIWRAGYVKDNGRYAYNVSHILLCDDSKEQFIEELQRLLYVINNIHIKNKFLHPAIRNINLIDYTYIT